MNGGRGQQSTTEQRRHGTNGEIGRLPQQTVP
jgi:hypothetical protein